MRTMQDYHMDAKNWTNIGYNFVVGGDGNAYEGCGWDIEGAHTFRYNKRSICIAFTGNFDEVTPPEKQIDAALCLISYGVNENKIANDFKLYGQSDLRSTKSPGKMLYEIIRQWDHWSDEIV